MLAELGRYVRQGPSSLGWTVLRPQTVRPRALQGQESRHKGSKATKGSSAGLLGGELPRQASTHPQRGFLRESGPAHKGSGQEAMKRHGAAIC